MGCWKAGRNHASQQRQADVAGLEDHFRNALPRCRRADHRSRRTWNLLLPEGTGAEVPPDAGRAAERRRRFTEHRHPSRVHLRQPEFHSDENGGAYRKFSTAHAPAWKAMSMEAIFPNGQTMMLSHVNNFNFNWHNNYVYADDAAPLLPKGTILKITSWYDNTANNPHNPDPNQWVGFGDRTVDEMGHAWVNITYMSDEDFQAEVAKRKE